MNTEKRIRDLAVEAGFQVEELRVVGSYGSFERLGPVGLIECVALKLNSLLGGGRLDSNIICALRKR
jgi:hypothetical protein